MTPPSLTSRSHSQRLSESHEFSFWILIPMAILVSLLLSLTRIKALTSHYFILARNANTSSHVILIPKPLQQFIFTILTKLRCHDLAYEMTMVRLLHLLLPTWLLYILLLFGLLHSTSSWRTQVFLLPPLALQTLPSANTLVANFTPSCLGWNMISSEDFSGLKVMPS